MYIKPKYAFYATTYPFASYICSTPNQPNMSASKMAILALLLSILFSCSTTDTSTSPLAKPSDIPSQQFKVDAAKDTTITTEGGIKLYIQKGTFTSNVTLEFKEALSFADMAKYNLNTMSDGKLLSSDGMFYMDAKDADGKQPAINIPIKVDVPATTMLENPQLFNGKVDDKGNINWVNPQRIANDTIFKTINIGESVFNKTCASCHNIGKGKLIGPDLAYIHKRRTYQWFADYTRNPLAMLKKGDACAQCLADQYNNTIMPQQQVSDLEMKQLWMYIMKESYKTKEDTTKLDHLDCGTVKEVLELIDDGAKSNVQDSSKRMPSAKLIENNKVLYEFSGPDALDKLAKALTNRNYVYSMSIKEFGWVNIDEFLVEKPGTMPTAVNVKVENRADYADINVHLLVPSIKANVHLKSKKDQAFGLDDVVYLTNQTEMYIYAVATKEDKLYAKLKKVNYNSNLTDVIALEETTFDKIDIEIKAVFGTGITKPEIVKTIAVDTVKIPSTTSHTNLLYRKRKVRVPCGLFNAPAADTTRGEAAPGFNFKSNITPAPKTMPNYQK